jgi:DNA-directed RNA polymerase
MSDVTSIERQHQREVEAVIGGLVRYRENAIKLRTQGAASVTGSGHRLMAGVVAPMAEAISRFVETSSGKRGPKPISLKYLTLLQPDVVAYLALRSLIDGAYAPRRSLTSVALDVGGRLRDEVRFASFEEQEPRLYNTVQNNLKVHPAGKNPRVRRSMLTHTMLKNQLTVIDWPKADRMHLGVLLVEMAVTTTGLFSVETSYRGKHRTNVVRPTQQLLDWIKECDSRLELTSPLRQPMVCPPQDWTGPRGGGYLTPRLQTTLVRGRGSAFLKELELADLSKVYRAINALQRTPWRINSAMLTLVEEIEGAGREVEGLASPYPIPPIPRPENYLELEKEDRRSWKLRAAEAFRQEERRRSGRLQVSSILHIARSLKDEEAIYFPHYLDFRGRMYPQPQGLNPQGTDLAKSLLTFAEAKPLGASGVRWLKIHLANMYGVDKVSLDERVQWTEENSERIVAAANDPLGDAWWTEADKPFCFLAAACEWIMVQEEGESYASSLPVTVDGSNNGLQHLSAMLRDESCGRLVNLVPSDVPADVYASVAQGVEAALRPYISDTGTVPNEEHDGSDKEVARKAQDSRLASLWMEYGINRSLLKRPVMILPYGGTVSAMQKYVVEYVLNNTAQPNIFGAELNRAANLLSRVAWDVMDGMLIGPRRGMDWMRKAGQLFVKSNRRPAIPITWTTPTGFLVQQKYVDSTAHRVKTKLGDQLVYLTLQEDTDGLDARKMGTALSPNFVHSLDAAALALTIGRCRDAGMTSFSAVHDSYGTHACEMDELFIQLREAFIEMYQVDVLGRLGEEIQMALEPGEELDPAPTPGRLDLSGVRVSQFFFA